MNVEESILSEIFKSCHRLRVFHIDGAVVHSIYSESLEDVEVDGLPDISCPKLKYLSLRLKGESNLSLLFLLIN